MRFVNIYVGYKYYFAKINPKTTLKQNNYIMLLKLFPVLFREPPFAYAFGLLEQFADRPKQGKGKDSCGRRYDRMFRADGKCSCTDPGQCKNPPTACSPMVFGPDDHRMEQSDDQKRYQADRQACQMILCQKIHGVKVVKAKGNRTGFLAKINLRIRKSTKN